MIHSEGNELSKVVRTPRPIDARLAAYLAAAGAATAASATDADAAIVGSNAVIPIGINSEVNIDFNSDGYPDIQLDHDRYNLNGTDIDYLQVDKNDLNSEIDPLPVDWSIPFSGAPMGVNANDNGETSYLQAQVIPNDATYPAALQAGDLIGPTPPGTRGWDFQESDNFFSTGTYRRSNRLIDEDKGQIDESLGQLTTPPNDTSEWEGLGGEVRYLGLRFDFNNASQPAPGDPHAHNYGWVGVRITNQDDATGEVVGWAYETELDTPIEAGKLGVAPTPDYDDDGDVDGADFLVWQRTLGNSVAPFSGADGDGSGTIDQGDFTAWAASFGSAAGGAANQVPEPGSMLMTLVSGAFLLLTFALKRKRTAPVGG